MSNISSFEINMKRLEQIVSELENKSCTLDESVALFEEGIMLSKSCSDALKAARGKMTVIDEEESKA